MNDLILRGLVNDFAANRGLSGLPPAELFEAFATSSILRRYHQSDITDAEDAILVGGSRDGGIDAIALLVNGHPVTTTKDIDFFADKLRRLEVEFVFVQAKTSPAFSAKEIGTFVFGVKQFFSEVVQDSSASSFRNEIQDLVHLGRYIYSNTVKMQENPQCFLYFATTGKWDASPEPENRFLDGVKQLEGLNLFSSVTRRPVDAALLKRTYQELERSVEKDVEFGRATVFPRVAGVDQAYIGLLPGNEFVKLVSTTDGDLNRSLFYDNVRDYQGNNPVNQEIDQTLSNKEKRNSFPLLNNGVTIVAQSIRRIGDTFKISDFQIVNGCQTTHVLFGQRDAVDSGVFVPVKLVATSNSAVIAEVIKATNRQTEVRPEALESLGAFHKDLEAFYNAREANRGADMRIYYERRSKQYHNDPINPTNIVTLTGQIKSFVAMFLNEPHSHPRYYGELLKSYEDRLFVGDHNPAPYYTSGVSLLAVEKELASGAMDRWLRPYKHQLLMLLRILIGGYKIPGLNSRHISTYSLGIVSALRGDEGSSQGHLQEAVRILRDVKTGFRGGSAPPHRLKAFTEELLQKVGRGGAAPPRRNTDNTTRSSRERGRILLYSGMKSFGFIEREAGGDLFVHDGELDEVPWHLRTKGTEVDYTVIPNRRRSGALMAGDVKLIVK